MQIRRRLVAPALLSVLAAALPSTGQAAGPPVDPVRSESRITLVTGDSVMLRPDRTVGFRPAPGSRSPGAVTVRAGGRTFVIPYAAMPALAAGRLDRTQFDVTALTGERPDPQPASTAATAARELTVSATNPDGTRAAGGVVVASRLDGRPGGGFAFLQDGAASLQLEDGPYDVSISYSQEPSATSRIATTMAAVPDLDLSADRKLVFDGRKARPVTHAVEGRPELRRLNLGVSYRRVDAAGTLVSDLSSAADGPVDTYAIPSPAAETGELEFGVIGRLELPRYALRSLGPGGADVRVLEYPRGAPRFDGTRTLPVADAGVAAPADLDSVRDKLAVIRRTPEVQVGEQVLAAQRAGAAAALVYDTSTMYYPIESFEPAGATIPTMNARWPDAQRLLDLADGRAVSVRLSGSSASRFSYDLVRAHSGRIPARLSYTAGQSEFARVDQTFTATGPEARMSEMWVGTTPLGASSGLIRYPETPLPFQRTSYLLGGPARWMPQVELQELDLASLWFGTARTYRAGEQHGQRWFGPVLTAGPTDTAQVGRTVSTLAVGLSPFARRDHWEDPTGASAGDHRLLVYRDGQQIAEGALYAEAEVPSEPADYRITLDSSRDLPWWRTATRITSNWTFRSAGGDRELMPLLMADVDVPSASPRGEVTVGRATTIRLGLRHQQGSSGSAITAAKLEISPDGQTWTELPLTRAGEGEYTATVTHPAAQAGGSAQLRISATDANGGRLDQRISTAYTLVG